MHNTVYVGWRRRNGNISVDLSLFYFKIETLWTNLNSMIFRRQFSSIYKITLFLLGGNVGQLSKKKESAFWSIYIISLWVSLLKKKIFRSIYWTKGVKTGGKQISLHWVEKVDFFTDQIMLRHFQWKKQSGHLKIAVNFFP